MQVPLLRLLTAGAAALASANASPSVTLPTGATVTGSLETNVAGNPVQVFRGIPYAEPPVGDLRWKPPVFKPTTADLNATSYGKICHGNAMLDPASGLFPQSEDCLFLNVFSPAGATQASKLPVMVLIHGGGFIAGAANLNGGANIIAAANEKLLVVTLNYRLGIFGFFSNRELLAEGGGANFGLQDQELAFEWVKMYIQYFGGDPENITAFGESAGSMSIAMHMLARDGNQQLFKRAIMQSGAYTTTHDTATPQVQESQAATIAKAVGCDRAGKTSVLSCLREANATAVHESGEWLIWFPTVDGVYMKQMPIRCLLDGKISRVPTIIGTNADEGWFFVATAAEASQFDSFLRTWFTAHHRAAEIYADAIFVCPAEHFSATMAESQTESTYHYYFNYTSNENGYPLVVHAKDVAYVFNQVENLPNDEEAKSVVGHFQRYWTNFASTSSPNGQDSAVQAAGLVWPKFDTTRQQLVIQPTLAIETNGASIPGHKERCRFWLDVESRITSDVSFA